MKKFLQNYILELTVFTCGGLVMIYEIIGSRILSPFIGTSTYTWTSLIGVILAALSLGYWLGGKFADKKPDVKILASAIFLAGGLVAVTIFIKDIVLTFIANNSLPLEIKSVIAALILFAPASVLLGFVTPYAVKLKTTTLDKTGETVGRLYALSTIGSIVGTFSAGFFLIPFVGSTRTLYFITGTLIVISILLAPFAISKTNIGVLVIYILGIISNEAQTIYQRQSFNFHDIDTEYSRVQIFDTTHNKTGRKIRAMAIDPFIYQSSMFLDDRTPASEYHKYYHLIKHFNPDFQNALMIGGAGYSFPKEYLKNYPDKQIEVVEIDPAMTELAQRFFSLKKNPNLKIRHEDGRTFLNRANVEQYDAVLLDAFTSLFSVPFQLTTIEAVEKMHHTLKPKGVVIFNLSGAETGKHSKFLKSELATYQKVFPNVRIFRVDQTKSPDQLQNYIIVALKSFNPPHNPNPTPENLQLIKHQITINIPHNTQILTDDLAPVEYYNSF